jgi:thiamine biosynthesis protein ThiS
VITITLNGQPRQVNKDIVLDNLIDLFALPKRRVAVELNKNVVRRTDWPLIVVKDGDRLEVVHLVGGG